MKVTMNESQMLEQWKLRGGLLLRRTDCSIEMTTGIDVDQLLKLKMRDWYVKLLDEGGAELLSPRDIAEEVAMRVDDDGVGVIELPDGCRRVLEVELDCWKREATVVKRDDRVLAPRQLNRYSRGGVVKPVAVVDRDCVRLYSVPSGVKARVKKLQVVMAEDGVYEMDERALGMIPTIE
jgi:hypothetical protein